MEYVGADPMASAGPREAFEVTLARAGTTYTIPADRTIVQTLAENGIVVPTSCEQGVCGTCLTGVLEGTPDHRDAFLSEAERKAGEKLIGKKLVFFGDMELSNNKSFTQGLPVVVTFPTQRCQGIVMPARAGVQ